MKKKSCESNFSTQLDSQKDYKSIHKWVGKVTHGEMCKKFKFNRTNKWYMHNPVSVLENDTQKLPMELWYTNESPNLV